MGRFPTLGAYEVLELEPVAGERRFQFRGPGLDPEHLGVIMTDRDEALVVVSLLERAFAAGKQETFDSVLADMSPPQLPPGWEDGAPGDAWEPEDAAPTEPEDCLEPFAYGGDDAPEHS